MVRRRWLGIAAEGNGAGGAIGIEVIGWIDGARGPGTIGGRHRFIQAEDAIDLPDDGVGFLLGPGLLFGLRGRFGFGFGEGHFALEENQAALGQELAAASEARAMEEVVEVRRGTGGEREFGEGVHDFRFAVLDLRLRGT
jgi:hypothetical protein